MNNIIRDSFIKLMFKQIQSGKIKEDFIFKLLSRYFQAPLTDAQKEKARWYIGKIRSGEMTFESYLNAYEKHTKIHDKKEIEEYDDNTRKRKKIKEFNEKIKHGKYKKNS